MVRKGSWVQIPVVAPDLLYDEAPRGAFSVVLMLKLIHMAKEKEPSDRDILRELEPVVANELNRHLDIAQDWHPHDYVPWTDGENFAYLGGRDWEPAQSKLGETARKALIVGLLTEDNLPSYHREIATTLGLDSAWGQWVGRWTAEENRHSIVIRDHLVVTRAVDPVDLEQRRMEQMTRGYTSNDEATGMPKTLLEALAYVTMQELATRISHRNTGIECAKDGDELAKRMLARVAMDENLHMIFYRNLMGAAFDIAPNRAMEATANMLANFGMPGKGMRDFRRFSVAIAKAGIYNPEIHLTEVVEPTLRKWNIANREDLTGEGAAARDMLLKGLDAKKVELARRAARREEREASKNESELTQKS